MADVDARHLFANKQDNFPRQRQLFVQLANLCIKKTERRRQPCGVHFKRCEHLAELAARKIIGQLHDQTLGLFDWWKECIHMCEPPSHFRSTPAWPRYYQSGLTGSSQQPE